MNYATTLAPTFLFVHQFNEYGPPGGDEGWDANTTDGIEPTNATGFQTFDVVQGALARYKAAVGG